MILTFGSLFAGIGGFDLGLERAGLVCRWQVEIDERCRQVLARHWPDVPRYGDVKHVGREQLEPVDVICGGFPCQDVSVAGRREGLAGERSGLWFEFLRVITELEPEWVVIENVAGLLSSNGGRDMATIVGGLAELRYWWAYRVLDLQYWGVPQRRRRVFIVGCLTRGRPQEVLFERESSPWDTAPGREAGQELARDVAASLRNAGNGARGWTGDNEQGLTVANAFNGYTGGADDNDAPAHHLVAYGFRNSGRDTDQRDGRSGIGLEEELSYTLQGEQQHAVCFGGNNTTGPSDVAAARNAHGSNRYDFESETFVIPSVSPALRCEGHDASEDGRGRRAFVCAFTERTRADGRNLETQKELAYAITNPGSGGRTHSRQIAGDFGVRRLTPLECERLQGVPDGHTDGQSDSARYRQLGNAVGVPHSLWIGQRIVMAEGPE
jgi:DNA (cytosine-5)-methyltransferase 1